MAHSHLALRAEAAVLAGHSGASRHLTAARPVVAGNPIATAILDRAAALLDADHGRMPTIAAAFETAGCPLPASRTLILAGGDTAAAGNAASSTSARPQARYPNSQ